MEIGPDDIISSESYDKYGLSPWRQSSNNRVLRFMNKGLMSQAAVYERYTETLLKPFLAIGARGRSEVSTISEGKFESVIKARLAGGKDAVDAVGLSALFDILTWHAAFPFPCARTPSGAPVVDENAFLRAICLLTRDPAPYGFPSFRWPVCHGLHLGENWGPHRAGFVSLRGRDPQDLRRYLFRSLAEPVSHAGTASAETINTNATTPPTPPTPTTIPVPRCSYTQPTGTERDEYDPVKVIVVEREDERRPTPKPLRESYALALAALPRHAHDLADLRVPTARLVALVRLLHAAAVGAGGAGWADGDGIVLLPGLHDEPAYIRWERFDVVLAPYTERIVNGLSTVFSVFKAPPSPDLE
ncbi:594eb852-34db-4bc3-b38a-0790b3d8c7c3 [Thermothielavioides terrestris]|uniref:594eb852-34db-4bc3-b38a-0790b3d8c7c3 n=1 Tax=Thermothielavioides terrestris TaxID=2587410 RepID=A0A446BE29_9PEZI|nr:594eb852-34db-4bc3-b38a-0790b3d8c7c3 [Thermothielavioides terrestris]